ncbi:MAG: hypothetical protein ED859_00375 [Desulfuromonadales bacterium]|nr:MAG: hypothetical protein ED859_00375 [Desulfuromonadales bacterium]
MGKRLVFLLISCATLSGCASTESWHNPNKTSEETQRDYKECKDEAYGRGNLHFRNSSVYEVSQSEKIIKNAFNECMQLRGYRNEGQGTSQPASTPR